MPLTLNGTTGEVFPSWTTGTRPASPSAGQTGYNTTLNTLERYNGTTWGPIVTTSDSATVTPTMLSQPFTAIGAVATTSGTSTTFTGIPSWAKRVTLLLNGVSLSGTSVLLAQLGTSGSIISTGYNTMISVITTTNNTTRGVIYSTGFTLQYDNSSAYNITGSIVFSNVTSNVWVGSGSFITNTANDSYFITGGISLASALTQIKLGSANGTDTLAAGSANVFYE